MQNCVHNICHLFCLKIKRDYGEVRYLLRLVFASNISGRGASETLMCIRIPWDYVKNSDPDTSWRVCISNSQAVMMLLIQTAFA